MGVKNNNGCNETNSTTNVEQVPLTSFNILDSIQQKLVSRGINSLYPVQSKTYDSICSGSDAVVLARTGSGKTLAFALPIVNQLLSADSTSTTRQPLVLVLAPTRELVSQIAGEFQLLSDSTLKVASLYGGRPMDEQRRALRSGAQIIVGAPGRVADFIERNQLPLDAIRFVVLDEADRMLDDGSFRPSVEAILAHIYPSSDDSSTLANGEKEDRVKPQTLLFSATMPEWVSQVADKYLDADHLTLSLVQSKSVQTSTSITHLALLCYYQDRASTLSDVIRVYSGSSDSRSIIFCERKADADELAAHSDMQSSCHVFHGDIPQDKRELVLQKFRDGKYRTLVTTNVAARGLDIPAVDLVIQCQPPKDPADYVHRSGRTGRANRSGTSICCYTPNQAGLLARIEHNASIRFKRISAPTLCDIIGVWGQELVGKFASIPDQTWSAFLPTAKSLLASSIDDSSIEPRQEETENGTPSKKKLKKSDHLIKLLCCALAQLSGKCGPMQSRSLMTSRTGFVTYQFETIDNGNRPLSRKGLVYDLLRSSISPEILDSFKGMTFVKGRKACVFDVPADLCQHFDSELESAPVSKCRVTPIDSLPELDESDQQPRGGFASSYQDSRWQPRGGRFQQSSRGGGRFQSSSRGGWRPRQVANGSGADASPSFNRGGGRGGFQRGGGAPRGGSGFKRPAATTPSGNGSAFKKKRLDVN